MNYDVEQFKSQISESQIIHPEAHRLTTIFPTEIIILVYKDDHYGQREAEDKDADQLQLSLCDF